MATKIIDDTVLQDIAVAIQSKDNGGKMYDTQMAGRINAIPTANPYTKVNELYSGGCSYFKSDFVLIPPIGAAGSNSISMYDNMRYFSIKNATGYYYNNWFRAFGRGDSNRRWIAVLGKPIWLQAELFYNSFLDTLIFLNDSVPQLTATFTGVNIARLKIYIRDSILSSWKSTTNWATYANNTFGFSEAPVYSDNATYDIGDVCQYNGKFYSYCKEDLTSSTGNPPTGTIEDNEYWEYCADIEVI